MTHTETDKVLDTYMMAYILGEHLSNMTLKDAQNLVQNMPEIFLAWKDTQTFVRQVRQNLTSTLPKSSEAKDGHQIDFATLVRVAETVGEKFGRFQDDECKGLKAALVKMEDRGSGRVRLADFYRPALDGAWQFQESAAYLRQLGALDESNADKPSVIIPNFITSQSNCIASSSFYAVCCMDECEGLLGHLESQIAAPEASAAQIAELVADLSSSSVAAPRKISDGLLDRLGEIAAENGGRVPLHGRLFAQWMHHAYPRECPYPHLAGTTSPLTPDEWLKIHGGDPTATSEEMQSHVDKASAVTTEASPSAGDQGEYEYVSLPWAPEEELLVARPQQKTSFLTHLRNLAMFSAIAAAAYGLSQQALSGKKALSGGFSGGSMEKFLV